jgi:hypothetical protein
MSKTNKQLRDCPSCGRKEGIAIETSFKKDERSWIIGVNQAITKCSSCDVFHTMDEKFNLIKYENK